MPTITMVAGPNGAGKTTLTRALSSHFDLGEYINPDDIAASLTGDYRERVAAAQLEAEQRREACISGGRSFTYETVMSHPSKLDVFGRARANGFETRLLFVGLEDPQLNVDRVALRVARGGHDVPVDRIVARYHRTMAALHDAVKLSDAAFVFDNSRATGLIAVPRLFVEVSELGRRFRLHALPMPRWIEEHLIAKLVASGAQVFR